MDLYSNDCEICRLDGIENSLLIDTAWRINNFNRCWPKPYLSLGTLSYMVKAIVIGQDPTIVSSRQIEYALEANLNRNLGKFLREVFSFVPGLRFEQIYFTNLVKCRFKEKPGENGRDIYDFLIKMANNCVNQFLSNEIKSFENANLIFTLGRDTFLLFSEIFHIEQPTSEFKSYYGSPFSIEIEKRLIYVIPLPHQPTYDTANRYSVYAKDKVRNKLEKIVL